MYYGAPMTYHLATPTTHTDAHITHTHTHTNTPHGPIALASPSLNF